MMNHFDHFFRDPHLIFLSFEETVLFIDKMIHSKTAGCTQGKV